MILKKIQILKSHSNDNLFTHFTRQQREILKFWKAGFESIFLEKNQILKQVLLKRVIF